MARHGLLIIGLEYERTGARGSLAAFALSDGRKLWEHWLQEYQHGSGVDAPIADLAVFGTNSNSVVAVNPATGELRWRFETRGPVKAAPAVHEASGLVVAAGFDHEIHMIELATGERAASFRTGGMCYTTPLILDGRAYCGSSDRTLRVIDFKDCREIQSLDVGARVYAAPVATFAGVVFGTTAGRVVSVNPETLAVSTIAQVPDAVTNAVATSALDRRIFVPTYVNEIYAFEAPL